MREADVAYAMAAIRRALQQSPHAKDTAKGIHEFWIPWVEPRPYMAVTTRALQRLRELGEVNTSKQKDGRMIWFSSHRND